MQLDLINWKIKPFTYNDYQPCNIMSEIGIELGQPHSDVRTHIKVTSNPDTWPISKLGLTGWVIFCVLTLFSFE